MLSASQVSSEPLVHPIIGKGLLAINVDTVRNSVIVAVLLVIIGVVVRRQMRPGKPDGLQNLLEYFVSAIRGLVRQTLGDRPIRILPIVITMFAFIFTCNLFEVIGIGSHFEVLPAPTSDINLPLAMALYVIVLVHAAAIKNRGIGGYFKHYLNRPFPFWLFPVNLFMNVVDEIAKPLTLALRLFGNLLAGGLMLSLLAALVIWKIGPAPLGALLTVPLTVVWKLFDMAIGAIQAFIFALLTILYFDTAMAPDEAH